MTGRKTEMCTSFIGGSEFVMTRVNIFKKKKTNRKQWEVDYGALRPRVYFPRRSCQTDIFTFPPSPGRRTTI